MANKKTDKIDVSIKPTLNTTANQRAALLKARKQLVEIKRFRDLQPFAAIKYDATISQLEKTITELVAWFRRYGISEV